MAIPEDLLEEYRSLQSQLQKYYDHRASYLGGVVAATTAMMGLSNSNNRAAVVVFTFTLLCVGTIMTCHCNFQILRRIVYLRLFVEPHSAHLKWFTRVARQIRLHSHEEHKSMFKSYPLQMSFEAFTICYFVLAAIISFFALAVATDLSNLTTMGFAIALGWLILLPALISLQQISSVKTYLRLLKAWKETEILIQKASHSASIVTNRNDSTQLNRS